MASPVVVLQHGEVTPPGWLEEILAERGVDHRVIHLYAGEAIPDHRGWAAVVSLGGTMSAYEEDRYPFLGEEKQLLRAAVRDRIPVLGICLGSQLLADALGGRVFRGPRMEAAFVSVQETAAGRDDPVIRHLRDPVLSFHSDTWEPPPNARVLAKSAAYPQAFRLGTALALQFHAEASAEVVERWVAHAEPAVRAAGVVPQALLDEARAVEEQARRQAWELFGAWVEQHIETDFREPDSGPGGG